MERKAATSTSKQNGVAEPARRAAPSSHGQTRPGPLAELNGLIGNRAAGVLVQAKLAMTHPGDPSEDEADRIAEQVTRTEDASVPEAISADHSFPRRDHRSTAASSNGGEMLPARSREYFEPRFGHQFDSVRVHTDVDAAESARSLKALAYTQGSDIVFGAGQFAPETSQGKRLLAHELAHVVQQRNTPFAAVQRQRDPRAASEPAVVSLSVSLSGLHFVPVPPAVYPGGETRYPAMAAILRRLIGPAYRAGLENEIWTELDQLGLQGHNELSAGSTARAASAMDVPFYLDIVASNALVSLLENKFKFTLTLTPDQRRLLLLGAATLSAYSELKRFLPRWYDEYIFAREMAQREPLITAFQKITAGGNAAPGAREEALRDILKSISPGADVLEAIREDFAIARAEPVEGDDSLKKQDRIYAGAGYVSIWNINVREAVTLTAPADDSQIRKDLAVMFLAFLNTQPKLMDEAGADDGHETRVALLARFMRFAKRVVSGGTGDEQLFKQPARANAPGWKATLTSTPQLNPPLYDAALETDHRFSMSLEFAHVTDAFAMYSYRWDRVRIPDTPAGASESTDLEKAKWQRPSFGEVYDVRMRRARRYNAADIERISAETGVPFGTGAHDLVSFNNVM